MVLPVEVAVKVTVDVPAVTVAALIQLPATEMAEEPAVKVPPLQSKLPLTVRVLLAVDNVPVY